MRVTPILLRTTQFALFLHLYCRTRSVMDSSSAELPSPPSHVVNSRSSPQLPPLMVQKRGYASSNSSDIPFFSSDELEDASVNDYSYPRHKRQYKRAWWEGEFVGQAHTHHEMRLATKQPMDSGIYMSSDGSSSSSSGNNDDSFAVSRLRGTQLREPSRIFQTFMKEIPKPALSGDPLVEHVVQRCLELDQAVVDLKYAIIAIAILWQYFAYPTAVAASSNLSQMSHSAHCAISYAIQMSRATLGTRPATSH